MLMGASYQKRLTRGLTILLTAVRCVRETGVEEFIVVMSPVDQFEWIQLNNRFCDVQVFCGKLSTSEV